MKKLIVLLAFMASVIVFATAQQPSIANDEFRNDPPARVFWNTAGLSDRGVLYKVLGQPDRTRLEDLGCALILTWTNLDYRAIYPRMSGLSQTRDGIKFVKKGLGWEIAHPESLSYLWVNQIRFQLPSLVAKK